MSSCFLVGEFGGVRCTPVGCLPYAQAVVLHGSLWSSLSRNGTLLAVTSPCGGARFAFPSVVGAGCSGFGCCEDAHACPLLYVARVPLGTGLGTQALGQGYTDTFPADSDSDPVFYVCGPCVTASVPLLVLSFAHFLWVVYRFLLIHRRPLCTHSAKLFPVLSTSPCV